MDEDEKMKLRYLREQRDMLAKQVRVSKKRSKFNLDSDDEDGVHVLRHRGRQIEGDLGGRDDFDGADLGRDSDDDDNPHLTAHQRKKKGNLTDEMVNKMNFGGGDPDDYEEVEEK